MAGSGGNSGVLFPIAVAVIVAVALVAAALYPTKTATASSSTAITAGSTELGNLRLSVTTNSSLLTPGHSLGITVSLTNTATEPLNLSAQGNWTVPGFPVATSGGCFGAEPIEFMIVRGNFDLSNLRQDSVNSSDVSIICAEGGPVSYFLFEPDSYVANLTGSFCEADCHSYSAISNLTSSFSVQGYWGYPLNSSEANDVLTPAHPSCEVNGEPGGCITYNYPEVGPIPQHPFVAGMYTLVACDEWNQTVLLHFTI